MTEAQVQHLHGNGAKKLTMADLNTKEIPSWCPGCGDGAILTSVKFALMELQIPQEQVLIVSGIGCGSKLPHFIKTYGFEGLHGRALPVAAAAKLVNKDLTVIVVGGDGDGYGIGGNHFYHALRRNMDITYIVQNNEVYGLTKGQYSPTSPKGFKSPSTPQGAIEEPVNPMATAIACGASFVARAYAFDIKHAASLIAQGVRHKGFALIDILQPCTTYNKINNAQWYTERIYKLEEAGHDTTNFDKALDKAYEWGDRIPIGVLWKQEGKPTYEDSIPHIQNPPANADISNINITPVLEKFRF